MSLPYSEFHDNALHLPPAHQPFGNHAVRADEELINHGETIMQTEAYRHYKAALLPTEEREDWQEQVRHFAGIAALGVVGIRGKRSLDAFTKAHNKKRADLEEAREGIAEFMTLATLLGNDYAEKIIEPSIEALRPPAIFREWRSSGETPAGTWWEWLASKGAGDPQLLNFLQWHNAEIYYANTDPDVKARIAARREAMLHGAKALFDEGYLHPKSRRRLHMLSDTQVYAGDVFEAATYGAHAYTFQEERAIFMPPYVLKNTDPTILDHELAHKLVRCDERWLKESATDLIAGMIRTGSRDPKVAFESMLINKKNPYAPLNSAVANMLSDHSSDKKVKAFLHYATASPRHRQDALAGLNKALGAKPGTDIIGRMTPIVDMATFSGQPFFNVTLDDFQFRSDAP